MGSGAGKVPSGTNPEESEFLIALIRRVGGGVTEGQLQTLIYAGQRMGLIPARYVFSFQELVPFCEELDLKIAKLVWSGDVSIQDNRIKAGGPGQGRRSGGWSSIRLVSDASRLDKLFALSYDSLKFLAAALHLEQDLQHTRQDAVKTARRFFSVQDREVENLIESCGG